MKLLTMKLLTLILLIVTFSLIYINILNITFHFSSYFLTIINMIVAIWVLED